MVDYRDRTSSFGLDVPAGLVEAMKEREEYHNNRLNIWVSEDWAVEFGHTERKEIRHTCDCDYCEAEDDISYDWVCEKQTRVSELDLDGFVLRAKFDESSYMWLDPEDSYDGNPIIDRFRDKCLRVDVSREARVKRKSNFPSFKMDGLEVKFFKPGES